MNTFIRNIVFFCALYLVENRNKFGLQIVDQTVQQENCGHIELLRV